MVRCVGVLRYPTSLMRKDKNAAKMAHFAFEVGRRSKNNRRSFDFAQDDKL
jgi:hypothetical protein